MAKSSRPTTTVTRQVEIARAAFAAAALALVLITGLFLVTSRRPSESSLGVSTTDRAELRTGTILLTPNGNNVCRKLAFDNETGTMQDRGSVACDNGASASSRSSGSAAPGYIDAIRESFKNR